VCIECVELSYGNPVLKLSSIRSDYLSGLLSIGEAIGLYPVWKNQDVYSVFAFLPVGGDYPPWDVSVSGKTRRAYYPASYCCVKLSKRGNDVYRSKVRRRFSRLCDLLSVSDDVELLSGDFDGSNLLFITLTYDVSLKSKDEAFRDIGVELNRFLSSLRQEYGSLSVVRCFEVFRNGYPHVHLIVLFNDVSFPVFRAYNRKGKAVYRVSDGVLHTIEGYWHSFVKVEGVRSAGGVAYLLKYILKEQYCDSTNTVGHLWFYHKQSYAVSRDFVENLEVVFECSASRLDTIMSNSNRDFSSMVYVLSFTSHRSHDLWVFDVLEPPDCESLIESRSMRLLYDHLVNSY